MEPRLIASGLRFPEGPVALADGSIVLVEVAAGRITRITPDGEKHIVAEPGGGPNGAALGPGGALYVCNNGGFQWRETGGMLFPGDRPDDYSGGRIERVDLATGRVEVLYRDCGGIALNGPNDLVFDAHGGFYFTDLGKGYGRVHDRGAVFYAKADGSLIRQLVFPIDTPNGIGLSPDGRTLYVALTVPGRVMAYEVVAPGAIAPRTGFIHGTCLAGLPGLQYLDSLAVDGAGHVCVATIRFPHGAVSDIAPDGNVSQIDFPDPLVTNLCFGGPERRTAYVTLSATGRLVALDWPRPGLKLNGG